jgi:uncharacterized protein YjbI with pentapeptide repeats
MSDFSRTPPEGEAPVNPYSLLEAVNHSSDTAHTGWLIFLAIMAYVMIAVAGVTHKDLLLEQPVELPVLQVEIQLTHFFQFAPLAIVLMHLGLIAQMGLLARETLELDQAIRLLEATPRRTHPLRLELNNFFFVQAIAGPQRSAVVSAFLHGMSWLTLVILPVILLIYMQVMFLPYHDIGITWTQRLLLVADIGILILIGVFLSRMETSFFQAFLRNSTAHPFTFLSTAILLIAVALFSFFVATVPGEALDRLTWPLRGISRIEGAQATSRAAAQGFRLPFINAGADEALFGVFRRNLHVTDTDLVVDRDQVPGEPSVSLRGRDLRYAQLDRSDLHQADLTGADLQAASLSGTDLRGVLLHCADSDQLLLSGDRVAARCTSARAANFNRARLGGADLTGIDARGATFEDAKLEGAVLSYSRLTGANFSSANLEKADLMGGVEAQGANFLIAALQGADLNGAQLQFADFSSASLQGAVLSYAQLQGAVLRDTDFEGASLAHARLEGADMTNARIAAADLRGAGVWMTEPPDPDTTGVADFGELRIGAITEADAARLEGMLEKIASLKVRAQVRDALAPILDLGASQAWSGSPAHASWIGLATRQAPAPVAVQSPNTPVAAPPVPVDTFGARLTDYLGNFMCRPRWSNGAVATGVARRAQLPQFRGDLVAIHDRLKSDVCPASKAVLPRVMQSLSAAADIARSR